MRSVWAAAAMLCVVSSGAMAADDPLAGYYGNTVISTGGMAEIHTHYRADHTFDVTGSMMGMSRSYKGTWELKGDQVCRTFIGDMPPRVTNPNCGPLAGGKKVGDTWTVTSNGSTRTITLKAGIQ